jgi:hypothetical protein
MEPVTLTGAVIATLVITKALEKSGEILGEKTIEAGGKLILLLKHKAPETAAAIERARTQPLDYDQAVVIGQQVEEAVKQDPEIRQAVEAVADTVKSQPTVVQNFGKLAEKIGLVVQGGTVNIENFTV